MGIAHAQHAPTWMALEPGKTYALPPIQKKPLIFLVAVRGDTLSEPVQVGFYVLSSPICKALENPINGPATGDVGTVGTVYVAGKDFALEGYCDGGNLTLTPSFWATRKFLFDTIAESDAMSVQFKPGPYLSYQTKGFAHVLADLGLPGPGR